MRESVVKPGRVFSGLPQAGGQQANPFDIAGRELLA
jgi:hypothetical protein